MVAKTRPAKATEPLAPPPDPGLPPTDPQPGLPGPLPDPVPPLPPGDPTGPAPDLPTSTLFSGLLTTVPIDTIKPYWRNPRRVTEDAVNQLVQSITQYGYQQPIVTDADRVIIVGHTRYAALRRMGVTQVPIRIDTEMPADKVKQYRLIDNKVGELTFWDYEALVEEIKDLDQAVIASFFPEIGPSETITDVDQETMTREWDKVVSGVGFTCPKCYHSWEVEVTREALTNGLIKAPTAQPVEAVQA